MASGCLTWHTMECPYSWTVEQALRFLIQQGSEAFVFHPLTGEWGQCQPMDTGARTLKAPGGIATKCLTSRLTRTGPCRAPTCPTTTAVPHPVRSRARTDAQTPRSTRHDVQR